MGEPYKKQDPEKGQAAERPSIMERAKSIFSKTGYDVTVKDDSDGDKMGSTKTPQKDKKNKTRKRATKKFYESFKPNQREEPKDTNIVGNITKLLPSNTFLMFQTLAPLATNDGKCGETEILMTSATLIVLASTCMLVCFTDTVQFNGKVYHGLVTPSGLWNPSFKGDPSFADLRGYEHSLAEFYAQRKAYKIKKAKARREGLPRPPRPDEPVKPTGAYIMGSMYSSGNSQYELKITDFLHAALSALAFGTVTMLTNPVLKCFYGHAPNSVVKTLPLLIAFIISAIFAFSPPARNGIAHPLPPKAPGSQTANFKPLDLKEVQVQGPSLPPKPPANPGDAKSKPGDGDDHDDLGGSVMKYIGKLVGSPAHVEENSRFPPEHHKLDGLKALASGFFSKHGADIKHGAAKVVQDLEVDVKKEANQLLLRAAPAVAQFTKDIHVPQELQEAAKSVQYEALIAGLVNAGAHPALAIAAVQSAAPSVRDAALNQIHQELQAVAFAPVAGLSKQSSLSLTRASSLLQSAGSSLSLPSAHDAPDALFHQVAEVLRLQNSGSPSNMHSAGPEAAAIALATGQALMHAGYQLPGAGPSPQAAALNAFAQTMGNQPNLNSVKALTKDSTSLVHQSGKSLAEIHDELARQSVVLTQQGLNTQTQTLNFPSVQNVASSSANSGTQTLNKGTLAATLTAGVAREEGANHGMAGVHAEIARQAELLKQKETWTREMKSQARALAVPATSVAQDLAALATTQAGSQAMVSTVNSRFVESLALGVTQAMARAGSQPSSTLGTELQQPTASVATDIASLLQQGSQMHAQLAHEASGLSPQTQTTAAMRQRQANSSQIQQASMTDTHMALLHLASRLSPPPASPEFGTSPSPPSWRHNASLVIEEVTDGAAAGQRGADRLPRGASRLLPSVTEELVAQAAVRSPSASQCGGIV